MIDAEVVLNLIPYAVFVMDKHQRIVCWNNAMVDFTGITRKDAVGAPCSIIGCGNPMVSTEPQCSLRPVLSGGVLGADWEPMVLSARNGSRTRVLRHASVLKNSDGVQGVVVVLADREAHLPAEPDFIPMQEHDGIIQRLQGKSRVMRDVRERVRLASQSEASVLILGETGTGKELVAEAIHGASNRRNGPLIKVNCSALSEGLLESELFGHVKGAFTGAIKDKIGRFEAADGGTIFLDEIGDVSPMIQLKLLRTLQERCFERVGEHVSRKIDVRVIAATNRDLRELVRSGEFREDFYYRIRVFTIHVPPLRERREDIQQLCNVFINRFREQTGKTIEYLSTSVKRVFMDYCWPGNVRELENTIEHAFVTGDGPEIGMFDLPVELRLAKMRANECMRDRTGKRTQSRTAVPFGMSLQPATEYDREELVQVLTAVDWNKAEAARRLGVARTTVWRQMKQWGIPLKKDNPSH